MMQPAVESLHDRRPEAGFSLIEVLIATALLLLIVIGTIPLFTRSMINNVQGDEASRATNIAVDDFERLLSLPFDALPTWLPIGDTTLTADDVFLKKGNRWVASTAIPSGDQARFGRTSTMRQYNVEDLFDGTPLSNPLPGGATESEAQIKVIDVQVTNLRMSDAPPYAVRVIKVF
jgi:Tfp pilus assembly protein PilV